jgi:hypothetical protein
MSVTYRGKEVLKLKRILEISSNKPCIVLACPDEPEITKQNKHMTVFQSNFYVQFPLEGKMPEKDIDEVRLPSCVGNVTPEGLRELIRKYKMLENSIDYGPEDKES